MRPVRAAHRGRRTALPRHQTLRATIDWSHELLDDGQRAVFRRLGVFAGWFSSDAAAVVSCDIAPPIDATSAIAELVAKSLLFADAEGATVFHQLPDTMRAYTAEKLADAGETQTVHRLHAIHCCPFFERAEAEWDRRLTTQWLATYAPQLDNLRVALGWAFSPCGDAAIGVALTAAAIPLWSQLSLLRECFERVEQSLAALGKLELANGRTAMKLQAERGVSPMYGSGPAETTDEAWALAYALAERIGDTDYRLRALWGLWAGKMKSAAFSAAYELAERFHGLARESADSADQAIGERMLGASLHFLGDQSESRLLTERMLSRHPAPSRRSHVVRYQFDARAMARMILARVLWLQGYADQALRVVDASVGDACTLNHTLSLCNTLVQSACPIALMAGDLDSATHFTLSLSRLAEAQHALGIWNLYAQGYRGQALMKQGDFAGGVPLVRSALARLRDAGFVQHDSVFAMALAEGLVAVGRTDEAMAVIEDALARSERSGELRCRPEMLRIKGESALRLGDVTAAEEHFGASLDLARRQAALAWELRTATSLARLRREQSRADEARNLLGSVVRKLHALARSVDARGADAVIDELEVLGRLVRAPAKGGGRGRPALRWTVCEPTTDKSGSGEKANDDGPSAHSCTIDSGKSEKSYGPRRQHQNGNLLENVRLAHGLDSI